MVDDPHHLLGRDPVRDHARYEGPGAGPDVDVELVDGPIDGQQVQRPQGADLVYAPGEPAAAEDEGGLRAAPRGSPAASASGLCARRLELDDLAHEAPL